MQAFVPRLPVIPLVPPRHGVLETVKKNRIWLIVGGLLVLDALTGVPSLSAIVTKTQSLNPSNYPESGSCITTTFCRGAPFSRGAPFIWKSCEGRIRMLSSDSDPV